MTTQGTTQSRSSASSIKMLRTMVGLGVLCALLIVLTYEGTFARIEHNKAVALENAIFKVLPGAVDKKNFVLVDDQIMEEAEDASGQAIYAGYDSKGELIGVAIEASGMGYADVIRVLYGYDPEKQIIIGFYVLESKETPGLGDKIEKDADFLSNFESLDVAVNDEGTSLVNLVTTVKHDTKANDWEVDGITGATISSRAIGDLLMESTNKIIPLIRMNRDKLKSVRTNGEG